MIISNLKGGLGNQMFEFAAGYCLAKDKNTDFKVDITHFQNQKKYKNETPREFQLDFFKTNCKFASSKEISTVKRNYTRGIYPILTVDNYLTAYGAMKYPILTHFSKDIYMDSYFQNEKYFAHHKSEIQNTFSLENKFLTKEFNEWEKKIKKTSETISIHIRRGDYITNLKANKWHGVLNNDYYYNSIKYIKREKKINHPTIFLFSDDIKWVLQNLNFGERTIAIPESLNPAQTIILMSKCTNNIIANSSFSWWGAWLNTNEQKTVIAPTKWLARGDGILNGIIPKNWIRI